MIACFPRWSVWVTCCWAGLAAVFTTTATAEAPLHDAIDTFFEADGTRPTVIASDAEFLRRAWLDLVGFPPTAAEARQFLESTDPNKRSALIDQLLAHPAHPRHLAHLFDLQFMERRGNAHVPADDWQKYLVESFRTNKPLNVLAKEILSADGQDGALRPAARFYLDRGAEAHLLTRDVSRVFLGRDLQCAQCHDHPLVEDYLQADYQGLFAFLAPGTLYVEKVGDKQVTRYAEQAGSDVSYESVFSKGVKHLTAARLPLGMTEPEPFFTPGEEYVVRPINNQRPVPKFSRRARLAELITNGTNRSFNENAANRLWAMVFGRGLVHPLDWQHTGNPGIAPELLTRLGADLAATNYDTRNFLRELFQTRLYQRAYDAPQEVVDQLNHAAARVAEWEQLRAAKQAETTAAVAQSEAAYTALRAAETAWVTAVAEQDQGRAKSAEVLKRLDAARKAAADAEAAANAKQKILDALREAAAKTQAAAELLPQDKELAEAPKKLTDKATQTEGELPALKKALEEKSAAVPPIEAEFVAAKTGLEGVHEKVMPLESEYRVKEREHVACRMNAQSLQLSVAAIDRRLAFAKKAAAARSLREEWSTALAAASTAAPTTATPMTMTDVNGNPVNPPTAPADAAPAPTETAPPARTPEMVRQEWETAQRDLVQTWTEEFAIAPLKPLTPEQLAWSVLRVTGLYERNVQAATAELNQSAPLSETDQQDPAKVAARAVEIEQRTYDKLKGNVQTFVNLYGNGPGQPQADFFATADQALFHLNAGTVTSWLGPAAGNVTERAIAEADNLKAAEDLYLTIFARRPTPVEAEDLQRYLANAGADRAVIIQQLAWAMLNSAEFRFVP